MDTLFILGETNRCLSFSVAEKNQGILIVGSQPIPINKRPDPMITAIEKVLDGSRINAFSLEGRYCNVYSTNDGLCLNISGNQVYLSDDESQKLIASLDTFYSPIL